MDLSSAKVTPEQKVSLCTKYFYLGFLCLPFLWGVNAAWFFGEAFRSKTDYLFRDSGHLKCQLTFAYIPDVCYFFTWAKFLENKIYTENANFSR